MAVQLTAADTKLLTLVWQCFDEQPKVDTKKLAELAGYANSASANTCWYNLKTKLVPKIGGVTVNLTEKDHKLVGLAWQCFKTVPEVDKKKLAELGGYKSAASANTSWYNLRKKLFAGEEGAKGSAGVERKAAPKRKAKAVDDATAEDGEDDDVENTVPAKRRRTRKPKTEDDDAVKAEDDEEGGGAEKTLAMKKRGRKPKAAKGAPISVGTTVEGTQKDEDDFKKPVKKKIRTEDEEVSAELLKGAIEHSNGSDEEDEQMKEEDE